MGRAKLPERARAIDYESIGLMLESIELQPEGRQKLESLLEVREEIMTRAQDAGMKSIGADELLPILVMSLIWSPLISPSCDVAAMNAVVDDFGDDGEVE